MAREKNEKSYLLPSLGIAGLGVPALALHGLDKELARAGLDRSIKVDQGALDKLTRFAGLRLSDVADPSMFLPEYVERANAAVNAKAFGDTRVADILNNSVISRFPRQLSENWKWLGRLGSVGKNLRSTIRSLGYSLPEEFLKAEEQLRTANSFEARLAKAMASHIPGVSGSYQDAYLRLLAEMTGVGADRKGNPLFVSRGSRADKLANDLYEAIVNHTNPTREGFKPYGSASEYIDALWHNTAPEGGLHAVPGAYRQATDIATDVIRQAETKEKAIEELATMIGGDKRHLYKNLHDMFGTPAEYGIVYVDGGQLASRKRIVGKIKDSVGTGKVMSKADALKFGRTNLATAIFHGDASRLFSGSVLHHAQEPLKIRAFNILQRIRSPYLRAALGAGALGSTGLLANNIIKNRRNNRSWLDKLKDMFR